MGSSMDLSLDTLTIANRKTVKFFEESATSSSLSSSSSSSSTLSTKSSSSSSLKFPKETLSGKKKCGSCGEVKKMKNLSHHEAKCFTQTEEPFTKREEKGTELLDYDNC